MKAKVVAHRLLGLCGLLCLMCASALPTVGQSLPVVVPEVDDPLLETLSIPSNASTEGMWSPVMSWPLVSIHVALLPDGSVLTFGSPLGVGEQRGEVFDRWDPATLAHTTSPNAVGVNSFCAAGILQQSGDMLVSGGNSPFASSLFDYADSSATGEPSNLASERWYATLTMMSDGRSLITGGEVPYNVETWRDPNANLGIVSMTPEIYTPGSGWSSLFGANSRDAFGPDHNRWWYPRQWVAPNGEVFGISSEQMWYLDPAGSGSIDIIGTFKGPVNNTTRPNIGPTCTAAMYDVGKILQVGGNGYHNGHATNSSEFATMFDITNGDPVVTETSPMQHRRQWANATLVPTGDVIVTGGTRFADNGGSDAVYQAEIWDPDTDSWDGLASAAVIRNYHSTTILLPNGTIFSSGGGVPGPVTNLNAEIFYPPYLFEDSGGGPDVLADRPRMLSISGTQFGYGADFQVEMADSGVISRVALVGLGSTTHSFNMGQRYYPAAFSQAGTLLTVSAPPNANLAPPGYYLLFAVAAGNVPSRGLIVAIDADEPGCATDGECADGNPCTDDACDAGICTNTNNGSCSTDPLAVYPFDEGSGSVALDVSGNAFDATLENGAAWAAGLFGGAVDINGSTQFVDLPNGLVAQCDDFTFAAWVWLDANDTWNRIFDFGHDTVTNMFLTPAAGSANTLRFALKVPGINGGAEQQVSASYTFPLGTWTHVAVVLEGSTGRLYVNGSEIASATVTGNPSNMGATANNGFGDSQYSADPALNGRLDEVRISCRAYTEQEVESLADPSPVCGDDNCSSGEDCSSCPADCGACPPMCDDGTCDAGEDCTTCPEDCGLCAGVLINADFENGAEGFGYVDDPFRETSQPDYASGSVSVGTLQVLVGGVDDDDIQNMSGGWSASFILSMPATVDFSFDYSLDMSTEYEADECSEVLVGVDGVLYGTAPDDFVVQLCDGGTLGGTFGAATPQLSAGSHTLTVGGFNNLKTLADEQTAFQIDRVLVTENPAGPGESALILATGHTAGVLHLAYTPACGSTNHDVYYGPLPSLHSGETGWTGQVCDIGIAGTHDLQDPDPDSSYMFVIVGNRDGTEGSYGRSSSGEERPAFDGATCSARVQIQDSPCSAP